MYPEVSQSFAFSYTNESITETRRTNPVFGVGTSPQYIFLLDEQARVHCSHGTCLVLCTRLEGIVLKIHNLHFRHRYMELLKWEHQDKGLEIWNVLADSATWNNAAWQTRYPSPHIMQLMYWPVPALRARNFHCLDVLNGMILITLFVWIVWKLRCWCGYSSGRRSLHGEYSC